MSFTHIRLISGLLISGIFSSCSTLLNVTTADDAEQAHIIGQEVSMVVAKSAFANDATVYWGHDRGMFTVDIYGIQDNKAINQIAGSLPTVKMSSMKFNEKKIRITFIDKEKWSVKGNYKERIAGKIIKVSDIYLNRP